MMKEITICVSPLVKRIFHARYGDVEPIKIHRSDIVYHLLQGDPVRVNPQRFQLLAQTLTENLTLKVSPTIYSRLIHKNRQVTVGFFLHKVYQEELLIFTEAQNLAGQPAQQAMKTYLDRHGITEDDYVLDSAYTAWLRRKSRLRKQKHKNNARLLQQSVSLEKQKTVACDPMPIDPRIVLREANKYFQCGFVNLICKNIRIRGQGRAFTYHFDPERCRQFVHPRRVLAYLLRTHSKINCEEMASIIHLPPRSLRRYVSEMRWQYEHYDEVKAEVDAIAAALSRAN